MVELLVERGAHSSTLLGFPPFIEELSKAALKRNVQQVKEFLEKHPSCLETTSTIGGCQTTFLEFVARACRKEIVTVFLDGGKKIGKESEYASTILSLAIERAEKKDTKIFLKPAGCGQDEISLLIDDFNECVEIIKICLEHKALIKERLFLHEASSFENPKIAALLLEYGADVNKKDEYEKTPLHVAVERGRKEVVKLLLSQRADVNAKDYKGKSPLHYAKDVAIAALLLEKGATIDALDECKRPPLYQAVLNGNVEMAEFLIEKGADASVLIREKNNLLCELFKHNYFKELLEIESIKNVLVWLINWGASPGEKVCIDIKVLLKTIDYFNKYKELKSTCILNVLIEHIPDINAADENGETPLFFATKKDSRFFIDYLITKGAHINAAGARGTALHAAVLREWEFSSSTVKFLLEQGADIEAQDSAGKTPLCYAKEKERYSLVNILEVKNLKKKLVSQVVEKKYSTDEEYQRAFDVLQGLIDEKELSIDFFYPNHGNKMAEYDTYFSDGMGAFATERSNDELKIENSMDIVTRRIGLFKLMLLEQQHKGFPINYKGVIKNSNKEELLSLLEIAEKRKCPRIESVLRGKIAKSMTLKEKMSFLEEITNYEDFVKSGYAKGIISQPYDKNFSCISYLTWIAIQKNYWALAQSLLERQQDFGGKDGKIVLDAAVSQAAPNEFIEALIKKGVDLSQSYNENFSLISYLMLRTIEKQGWTLAQSLLAKQQHFGGKDGEIILHEAVYRAAPSKFIKALIKKGARSSLEKNTLCYATRHYKDLRVIQLLIDHGALPELSDDKRRKNPLLSCISRNTNMPLVLTFLLKMTSQKKKNEALVWAVSRDSYWWAPTEDNCAQAIPLLIDGGAEVNCRSGCWRTPLDLAEERNKDFVRLLEERGGSHSLMFMMKNKLSCAIS